jgi:ubiquinone/menaquinone biosynthesis C-methylase UbiE
MTSKRSWEAYDRIAPKYAEVNAAMPPQLAAAARRFLSLVGLGSLVLDVGCGAGRDAAYLESLGLAVVGLDLSSAMLTQARARRCDLLVLQDMCHLGAPAARFRGLWCCASLLHLPKSQVSQALVEMHRVLVSGGVLFLSLQEGTGEGWEPCSYAEVERFFARYEVREITTLLALHGFRVLHSATNEGAGRNWLQFFAAASS